MTRIFDLDSIKIALNEADEQEDCDGDIVVRVYLGTVFSLTPSGKYYTSFANSNVTKKEAELDEEWYDQAENELDHIGAYLIPGDTDPCDLFAEMFVWEADE